MGLRAITGNILGCNLQDVMVHVLTRRKAGAARLPTTAVDKSVETGAGDIGAGLDILTCGGRDADRHARTFTPKRIATAYVVPHVSLTTTARVRASASRDMS
jgi:hypothetical protein